MAIKRPATYEHNNPNLPIVEGKNVSGGLFIMSGATAQERYDIPQAKLINFQLVKDTTGVLWELQDINQHDNTSGWSEYYISGGTDTFITGATNTGDSLVLTRNDGVEVTTNLSGATVEAVLYTNSAATPTTLGGVEAGSTFSAVTMQDMWTDVLYPTLNPRYTSFTIPALTTSVDVGYTFTGQSRDFTWSTTNSSFIQPDTVDIVDLSNATTLATGLSNDGAETLNVSYDIQKTTRTSNTFQIRAKKLNNTVFARNYYWNWYWRRFQGGSTNPSLDAAGIGALTGSLSRLMTGNYAFVAEQSYKYIAIPVSAGWINPVNNYWYQKDPTYIKDVSTNLNIALAGPSDGYNDVINGLPYKEMVITNIYGYTETYRVFRTKYKLGGAITIQID